MKKSIFCVVFLLLYAMATVMAQQQGKKRAAIDYTKFSSDSIATSRNVFTESGLIPPIQHSDANIEIRMYHRYLPFTPGLVCIIRGFDDSSEIVNYKYGDLSNLMDINNKETRLIEPDKIPPQKKALVRGYIFRQVKKTKAPFSQQLFTRLISELSAAGFFQIKDQRGLLDSLKANQVPFIDPCGDKTDCFGEGLLFFEVKAGKHFRNFSLLQADYLATNKTLACFKAQSNILSIIRSYNLYAY